ncbi:MAG TPA: hypothetical protein VFA41_11325 [Ktedonobacteraceae bacterium]|nr:hypothetical protein [Ktedonobacteraceae bacterium]
MEIIWLTFLGPDRFSELCPDNIGENEQFVADLCRTALNSLPFLALLDNVKIEYSATTKTYRIDMFIYCSVTVIGLTTAPSNIGAVVEGAISQRLGEIFSQVESLEN